MKRTIKKTDQILSHDVPATRITYIDTYVVDDGTEASSRSFETTVTYVNGCPGCERYKDDHTSFFPSHFASERCRSGGRAHCTCDTCF